MIWFQRDMRHWSLPWAPLLGALTSLSCGGSASGGNVIATIDASIGGGGGSSGSAANGGGNGRGGSANGQSGSIVIAPTDAQLSGETTGIIVGGGGLEDGACASELHQAEQLPLDIYIMLDISGSMEDPVSDGVTSKWTAVREAIRSFVSDPGSAGLGVGLQYFPLVQPGVATLCDPMTQATDCGQFGPCDVINACDNANTVIECTTAADCPVTNPRGTCARLGHCSISPLFCPFGTVVLCSNIVMNNQPDVCQRLGGNCRGRDICDGARYAVPAVEVATLPGAATNLINSLNAQMPTGLTPTAGALSGALTHAQALAAANPVHRVAVVLATDGFPTECMPQDIPGIANLAATALARMPSIPTFVIGVFSPADAAAATANLDALAQAGGSGRAFIINTGPSGDAGVGVADAGQNVTGAFLGALNAIRTAAVACEYNIPQPEAGRLDYGKVNVQFTSGTGQKTTIGYAGSADSCGTQGGWYYDVDPSRGTPSKIVVCDATCAGFKADPRGTVKVLLGCVTQAIIR